MRHSESLAHLAAALAKAQAAVKPALKTETNPFFKTRYADFASVLDACEDALDANDLALIQAPISTPEGIGVETMLLHASGEWLAQEFVLPLSKHDAQGGGSAVTYARRYALEGFLRIRREDDDGNAAAAAVRKQSEERRPAPAPPKAKPTANGKMPPTAAGYLRRLEKKDAELAREGVCQPGQLMYYVESEGHRQGTPALLADWPLAAWQSSGVPGLIVNFVEACRARSEPGDAQE